MGSIRRHALGVLLVAACFAAPAAADTGRWGAPTGLYGPSTAAPAPSAAAGSQASARYAPGRVVDWRAIAAANSGSTRSIAAPQPVSAPKAPTSGRIKVGRPYQINDIWYVPAHQPNYDQTGVASWYGPNFHGRATANGETFDMNLVSAAHPTLPIPSIVTVTNLENGRELTVRVNDRGPFARGRIIDLSRAAADRLGFKDQGTAQVRVRFVRLDDGGAVPEPARTRAPAVVAASTPAISAPQHTPAPSTVSHGTTRVVQAPGLDEASVLHADGRLKTGVALSRPMIAPSGLFVQVGAFTERARADAVVYAIGGPAYVQPAYVNNRTFNRVMVGPWPTASAAEDALRTIRQAGYPDARVVRQD